MGAVTFKQISFHGTIFKKQIHNIFKSQEKNFVKYFSFLLILLFQYHKHVRQKLAKKLLRAGVEPAT